MNEAKTKLQKATGKVIKRLRKKSITKSADEIGMWKSLWADLEQGNKDPQLSTLWRISEGLDMKPHELVAMIETELGDNFSFIENTL